ncbi:acyltransferase family-domain-containing protein [Xylariaceae sp. FL0804]|nr:acyltransferase family-domain-containing protein [Xylariaceae sp. FL0804]
MLERETARSSLEERLLSDEETDVESQGDHYNLLSSGARFPGKPWLATRPTRPGPWSSTASLRDLAHRQRHWPRTCGLALLRTLVFLLPSFVQPLVPVPPRDRLRGGAGAGAEAEEEKKAMKRKGAGAPGPTAYLDGMRGVAALFVMFCHYFYTGFQVGAGWGRGGEHWEVLRWPFVRLLYSGPTMVCVFFVISGYALSLRPLRLARGRSWDGLATAMASFAFRRPFRLYLPCAASTLGIVALLRLGAYEGTRPFATDPTFIRGIMEKHVPRDESTWLQLKDWAWETFEFIRAFDWDRHAGRHPYDVHLWTIPVEFRCSMALFLTQIATARLRAPFRLATVGVLAGVAMRANHWEVVLFLAGMVLAELDLIRGAHERPTPPPTQQSQPTTTTGDEEEEKTTLQHQTPPPRLWFGVMRPSTLATAFWTAMSVPALYLMSAPDAGPADTPGWRVLGSLIPDWFGERYRWWQIWGSVLFVACASRSSPWRRLLGSAPARWLGSISYAVYLVHGAVIHVVGYRVERWAYAMTGAGTIGGDGNGDGTEAEAEAAFVRGAALAAVINVPIVLWVADVFWRAVDAPIVTFAKWLEGKLIVRD